MNLIVDLNCHRLTNLSYNKEFQKTLRYNLYTLEILYADIKYDFESYVF